jgi:hypothetical protein
MKIFQLSDEPIKDWIVANTNIEALQIYSKQGVDIKDLSPEYEIRELSEEEAKGITITTEDHGDLSLFDYAQKFENPEYIASTEW